MNAFEIAGAILLIITSVLIVGVVLMQEGGQGMGSVITGADTSSERGRGRSNQALLVKTTKIAATVFFVLTLAVYAVTLYIK